MSRITVRDFQKTKRENRKLVLVTCYDYTFAKIIEDTESIDAVLVGDSLGMVIKGNENTLNVSLNDVVYHTRAVRRAVENTLIIADMPFMSFQKSIEQAVESAGELIKAGADAVKIEGGQEVSEIVSRLVAFGIPVMGHIGMTPQHINGFGGYRLQGRSAQTRQKLIEYAGILEKAGAFSIVLEMIPEKLGAEITQSLKIPTIGIGAGKYTDGQILVLYDVLGLYRDLSIKFVKQYADGYNTFKQALKKYAEEVRNERFPDEAHRYD